MPRRIDDKTISIRRASNRPYGNTYYSMSNHPLFNESELLVSCFEDRIVISYASSISNEKRYNVANDNRLHYSTIVDLPLGLFDIDEDDSDEDTIVVYFN